MLFYILTFIIGFGAIIILTGNEIYLDETNKLIGSNNMAAIHLSHAIGGDLFLGFISAVAFATILAVVSGLTLAGASAISHDLYAFVICNGKSDEKKEIFVSKSSTVVLGLFAIILGIAFQGQNVAFMVGMAFAIAASANFPILFLSLYWKNNKVKLKLGIAKGKKKFDKRQSEKKKDWAIEKNRLAKTKLKNT